MFTNPYKISIECQVVGRNPSIETLVPKHNSITKRNLENPRLSEIVNYRPVTAILESGPPR